MSIKKYIQKDFQMKIWFYHATFGYVEYLVRPIYGLEESKKVDIFFEEVVRSIPV